jgi:hypothetical protein
MSDVKLRFYSLPSCIFHALLYVIVAEKELHNFLFFLLIMDHKPCVCGDCRGYVALNDLCLVLLRNSVLGKTSLSWSLRQPCNVPLYFLICSLLDGGHIIDIWFDLVKFCVFIWCYIIIKKLKSNLFCGIYIVNILI